jgi:hypothetical protein
MHTPIFGRHAWLLTDLPGASPVAPDTARSMPLSKSPDAFKLRTVFMGSLGTIPESHARTVGKQQLTAWIKEGLLEHRRGSRTRRRPAEKLYPEISSP